MPPLSFFIKSERFNPMKKTLFLLFFLLIGCHFPSMAQEKLFGVVQLGTTTLEEVLTQIKQNKCGTSEREEKKFLPLMAYKSKSQSIEGGTVLKVCSECLSYPDDLSRLLAPRSQTFMSFDATNKLVDIATQFFVSKPLERITEVLVRKYGTPQAETSTVAVWTGDCNGQNCPKDYYFRIRIERHDINCLLEYELRKDLSKYF